MKVNLEMLKQSINKLDIENNIVEIFYKNSIYEIGDLCNKSKTDLKKIGLKQNEINNVQIKLQLVGFNIRGGL